MNNRRKALNHTTMNHTDRPNSTTIADRVSQAAEAILNASMALIDGDVDPIELAVAFKRVQVAHDQLKDLLRNEVVALVPKEVEAHGAIIKRRAGRANYKYGHITEWCVVNAHKSEIEKRAKDAAIAAAKGEVLIDAETGEEYTPALVEHADDSYTVKILKS